MKFPEQIINTGGETYVVPSIQKCVNSIPQLLHRTQHAIRIYEWLRGTEITPLLLTSEKLNPDGTNQVIQLGNPKHVCYPERWKAGHLLRIEQILLAIPVIQDAILNLIEKTNNNASGSLLKTYSTTLEILMSKVTILANFTASALYFNFQIPERTAYETVDSLDRLFSYVITQRDKVIYEQGKQFTHDAVLPEKYSSVTLDRIISQLHNAGVSQFYPNPEQIMEDVGCPDRSFVLQCMMAYSHTCNVPILRSYCESYQSEVFHWTVQRLNFHKDDVSNFSLRPKLRIV